jgi:uncharacterized protein (TIGR02391 family)
MLELRKKMSLPGIYARIHKIQEESLVTKEEAANLLATDLGIPVYKILPEPELRRLRELQKARTTVIVKSPEKEIKREVNTEEKEKELPITPNRLYDLLGFHPRIVKASKSLFKSGNYSDAIFAAFRCVEVLAKEKSGLKGNGADLMHRIFSEKNPVIKLNKMQEDYDIDEQTGFRFIYVGAMIGIRNPKAHAEVQQRDPYKTLEYLSLASLLAKRLEEGQKI